MGNFTQREKAKITTLQRDAYEAYLLMCSRINEVPRTDVVTLISGCTDTKKLEKSIDIFESAKIKS